MKYLLILSATFLSLSSILNSANGLRNDITALNISKTYALQMRAELCARKSANYAYVLDKKFYSEEKAEKIFNDCLNEL